MKHDSFTVYYPFIYIRIYIYIYMYIYIRFNHFFQLFDLFSFLLIKLFLKLLIPLHFFFFFFFFFNAYKYVGILLTKISSDLYLFSLINLSSIFFHDSFLQLSLTISFSNFYLISPCQSLSLPIIEY